MKYKYEDKVYFLEDILEEFEAQGGNKELAKDLYEYYYKRLDNLNRKTDAIVFRIPKFGNLYHNLSTLLKFQYKTNKSVESLSQGYRLDFYKKRLEVVESKITEIKKRITEAKQKGIKRIWFLWTKWKPFFKNNA